MENNDKPKQKFDAAGHTENHYSSAYREPTHPKSHWARMRERKELGKLEGKEQDSQSFSR